MAERISYLIPNLVIGGRVALAFVAIGLLSAASPWPALAGVALIPVVLALDGLDGITARRLGATSRFGAVLDITADRIVEHVFWIFFAVSGQVGLWVPLVVVTRSFVVDSARSLALANGKTAFGKTTLASSAVTRFLTSSPVMRNAYGLAKALAFTALGALLTLDRGVSAGAWDVASPAPGALSVLATVTVLAAVGLCVVRGIPVLWDSRPYLFDQPSLVSAGGDA